jgi:N-ATPase, AtpR subunit
MIAHAAVTAAVFAVLGIALGTAYFASLRRGLRIPAAGHAGLQYLSWAAARIAAAGLFFAFAVRWGLPAILAAFAGFLLARQVAVRAARRLA